jgi:hypothetical protein
MTWKHGRFENGKSRLEKLSLELHHELLRHQHPTLVAQSPWIMMSQDSDNNEATQTRRPQQPASRSIFNVPTPIKQLFDRFPLLTYPINDLPQRAPQDRNTPILHIFTTAEGASRSAPSYNPACLKWQV